MIDKACFKKNFGRILAAAGFRNQGQSWYLDGRDAIVELNLQKSDYYDNYYINFGIWLKTLGEAVFPKKHHCHIAGRVDAIFEDEIELVERGGRINTEEHVHYERLLAFFQDQVVPYCRGCLCSAALAAKLEAGEFRGVLVMKTARVALPGASLAAST